VGVRELYEQTLAERGYESDPAQLHGLDALEGPVLPDDDQVLVLTGELELAVAVVEQRDDLAFRTIGSVHERIRGDDANAIDLSSGERVERRQVIKPNHLNLDSCLLEPILLFGDFEKGVSRPIGISDFQRFRVKRRDERGERGDDE